MRFLITGGAGFIGPYMPRRVPDINKIRVLVGYEPGVDLDEVMRYRRA